MGKELLTRKDIERFGFHYEPNRSKCSIVQLRIVPADFDNKNVVVNKIYFQNVHSVYQSGGSAYVVGHGSVVSL